MHPVGRFGSSPPRWWSSPRSAKPVSALERCAVVGHQTKHGWKLVTLSLHDGAGAIELQAAWLPSERAIVALADRLLRSGTVTATP
jgi:hypothetical protein